MNVLLHRLVDHNRITDIEILAMLAEEGIRDSGWSTSRWLILSDRKEAERLMRTLVKAEKGRRGARGDRETREGKRSSVSRRSEAKNFSPEVHEKEN